ncbi:MAG TPA: hypothetical protein VGD45_28505 [Steroidobacter sp.]|uniref:hypothetical protein n=1 Tax=Steroidobacter sp. TaxID=1978227 RepID=UPI002EDA054E
MPAPTQSMPRLLVSAAAVALALVSPVTYAIREGSIAQFVSAPHAGSAVILRGGMFAYAGGIMFRGDVTFHGEDDRPVDGASISLNAQPKTGKSSLNRAGDVYELPIEARLACALGKFVRNDRVLAYSVPMVADDPAFFAREGLVEQQGDYVAGELAAYTAELYAADLDAAIEEIADAETHKLILDSMNDLVRRSGQTLRALAPLGAEGSGTYVNADFNVTYKVYLSRQGARKFVDFAGLPLQYFWSLTKDGRTPTFYDVAVFKFPGEQDAGQLASISMFHNAALFRWMKSHQPAQFERYVSDICTSR